MRKKAQCHPDRYALSATLCAPCYKRSRYHNGEKDKKQARNRHLLGTYGITSEEFEAILARQDGLCRICGKATKQMHLDHCHKTGKVRSILCSRCNVALGMVSDDPKILLKMLDYLAFHTVPVQEPDIFPCGDGGRPTKALDEDY